MLYLVTLGLLPLLISALTIKFSAPTAERFGLVDNPGGRKQHQGAVPLTGGVGIVVGFLLVQPVLPIDLPLTWPFYLGVLLLLSCGLYDDARDMSSHLKMGVQLLSSLVLAVWGVQLDYMGSYPWMGAVDLSLMVLPVTVIAVVALINAVNMLDGIDGLAGGLATVMLFWLAVIAGLQGQFGYLAVILLLGSAVAGFLLYNLRHPWRSKASVFMGDAGSMVLGFMLAWIAIDLSQSSQAFISPVAFVWVLAVPLLDMASLAVRRVRRRRHPFAPDREHLHHIFLRAGFSSGSTTMILVAAAFLLGFVGVLGSLVGVPDALLLLGLVLVIKLHSLYISFAWRTSKALRRLYVASVRGLYAHQRPRWHRQAIEILPRLWSRLAIGGLYVAMSSFAMAPSIAMLGLGAVLVASAAVMPRAGREIVRVPLVWLAFGLTLYLLVRSTLGGSLLAEEAWRVILLAGVVGVPVGWWLVRLRWHWPWLLTALLMGSLAGFVQAFNWSAGNELSGLEATGLWAGASSLVGAVSGVALIVWVAMLFAGLQRLGSGWRATAQVIVSLSMGVVTVVVLISSQYGTAWLGALVSLGCYVLASQVLGRPDGQRLGGMGVLSVLLLVLTGLLAWYGLMGADNDLWDAFYQTLQAWLAVLRGEHNAALLLHSGVAERGMLWQQQLQEWRMQPWWGNGNVLPAVTSEQAGYAGHQTFVGMLLAGFGLFGLGGFWVLAMFWLRALFVLGTYRVWPSSWVLGSVCTLVFLSVLMAFAMPVVSSGTLVFVMILSGLFWAAVLECHLVHQDETAVTAPELGAEKLSVT